MWFCVDHWHRYVLVFIVILYLSFVSIDLCFSIVCMENFSGLFFILGGGLGCTSCVGGGSSGTLGVSSLFTDMYCGLSVRACGCLLHEVGQFWLQLWW